ncbi:MAG: peptide synthase [Planctomycetaceae bacterium]|nr:MAG: peptide synthase [Planctomycetaceae bacterium]
MLREPERQSETTNDPETVPRENVASRLWLQAQQRPEAIAVYEPLSSWGPRRYRTRTFRELQADVARYARGLHRLGFRPGTRTVLMVPPSLELVRLVYGLLLLGAVPIFIDPGIGLKWLKHCLRRAQPAAFIAVEKVHWVSALFRWCEGLRWRVVAQANWSGWGPTTQVFQQESEESPPWHRPPPDELGAILFTSGSTGPPKGAVYTHRIFLAQLDQLQRCFAIEAGEIDLCTFPLFALFAPALGMTSVIPRMDFTRPARVDPREIWEPVRTFGVTNLFGSPALLNRVGRAAEQVPRSQVQMTSLKRVLTAGAPVSADILARFRRLLSDEGLIYTPYGATEALPVAVIESHEVLNETQHLTAQGAGTCVGRPLPGITVRIIHVTDEPIPVWSDAWILPAGEVGEIVVQGDVVTQGYDQLPEATCLAKIQDPTTGRCWHRMGDVGYFDHQGRLWFCGRKSQRVSTEQQLWFTDPVEGIFNAHPAVYRSALVGVQRAGGTEPVVCIEPEPWVSRSEEPQLLAELRQWSAQHPLTRPLQTFLIHRRFPVDIRHNAKIFREQLQQWAQHQLDRHTGG